MVGTLAHVLEAHGLATVAIALIRGQIEKTAPPRALYTQFPLGRPLGRPDDPEYQHEVLAAAFALLERPAGPVLEDFPEVLGDDGDTPLSCQMPLRHDASLHPAVDEALGIRPAYNRTLQRTGASSVGRVGSVDDIPSILEAFVRIGDGVPHEAAAVPGGDLLAAAMDVRSYYEEAAQALVDHVPGARQVDAWIYGDTEAGKVMHAAQRALHATEGVPRPLWYFLMPMMHSRIEP